MNRNLNSVRNWRLLAEQASWSVANLAGIFNVSVRALERHFKENLHKSPKAWLTEQRYAQAVAFLRNGFSAKETACQVGYRHASTFAREFKRFTGKSPHTLTAAHVSRSGRTMATRKANKLSHSANLLNSAAA